MKISSHMRKAKVFIYLFDRKNNIMIWCIYVFTNENALLPVWDKDLHVSP
jgi:hypothetical protein